VSVRYVESYVHGSKIGVLVELETVDDFATRTDEFQALAKDLAMQIAASDPRSVDGSEFDNVVSMTDEIRISQDAETNLLTQEFIKDPSRSVLDRIKDVEIKLGAQIKVVRFVRFEAGAT